MGHKVIVRIGKGRPDSLTKPVQIVFTVTPVESEGTTTFLDPVAVGHMIFSTNSAPQQGFEWGSELAFDVYKDQPYQGRKTCVGEGSRAQIPLGTAYRRQHGHWYGDGMVDAIKKQSTVRVKNSEATPLNLVLQLKGTGSFFNSIATYQPLAQNGIIDAPAELELQAYVVDGEGSYKGDILTAEHLTRPLLERPLHCESLPEISTWRLSQDSDGTIKLDQASKPPAAHVHSLELMAESISELKKQLSGVLEVLEATQERLAMVETVITTNHTDLSTTLNDARDQISRLDQAVPAVQARVSELEAFASHTKERGYIAPTPGTSTPGQASDLRQKLTTLMSKPGIVPARESQSGGVTTDGRSPNTARSGSSGDANPRPAPADYTPTGRDGALGTGTTEAPTKDNPTEPPDAHSSLPLQAPVANRDLLVVQESVRTLRQQVAGLDRRVPAMESKADKLASGFGQLLENLSSTHKYLQTARQRSLAMEARIPIVEANVEQLTGHMVDLASRLTTVEERAETLSVSLLDIREAKPLGWSSGSLADNPSANLPSGISGNSISPSDNSETETLPWLSLPQSLDFEFDGRLSRNL